MGRFLLSVCVVGLVCSQPNLQAQQLGIGVPGGAQQAPQLPGIPGAAGQPVQRREPMRMKLDFMGGSPQKLISDMTEALGGTRPNVIIHPEAAKIEIPPFSLRDVTLNQVFTALNMLGEPGQSPIWMPVNTQDGELWTLMPPRRQNNGIDPQPGMPVGNQPATRTPTSSRNCRVYNLTPVLDDYTVEDVTTAIKGAWELMN